MIPRNAVVTFAHPPGRLNRAVMIEPGSPRSIVRDLADGRQRAVPSHWLVDTCERVDVPAPAPTCGACIAEADGTAAHLFPWERIHSCRLRGAA